MGSSSGYQDPRIAYALQTLYGAAPAVGKAQVKYHNATSNADEIWDWRQKYDAYKAALKQKYPDARAMPYGLWMQGQRWNPESEYGGWWTPRFGQKTTTTPPATTPPPAGTPPPGGTPPPAGGGTPPVTTPPPTSQNNPPYPGWVRNPVTGAWEPPAGSAGGGPAGPTRKVGDGGIVP